MFSNILMPVDGSDNSLRAFDQAIFLAKKTDAKTTVVHVIENPPTVYVHSQKVLDELLSNYRKESAKILDKCKDIAEKSQVQVETAIMEGNAASNILGYAEENSIDLIVLGSRGMGQFKEIVLGSTSSKVVHHAKCAVLIVK